jgi:Zn-dependent protease
MSSFNLGQSIIYAIVIVTSLTIHEFAHGLTSSLQGDDTPERYGRLSLNPLAHLDIIGLLSLFIFKFGWAKPVPISSYNYKNQKRGIILTSIAGPLSNLLLSFIGVIFWCAFPDISGGLSYFLRMLIIINANLAVFNLLPFPPLDGSKIFAELLGGRAADLIYRMERYGIFILFLVLWIPQVTNFLSFIINDIVLSGMFTIVAFFL